MRIKKTGFCIAIVSVALLIYAISGNTASSKFAAKANGVGLKNATLESAVNNFIKNQEMMGRAVKEEDKDRLRSGILEELISAELLYQESKKADLGDLTKEINREFENIKNGFDSQKEFKKLLKERGIKQKDLKEDIKKGVYIKAFLNKEVYSDIAVTKLEKEQEYEKNKQKLNVPEQVRARHILIRVKEDASDEDKKNLKKRIEDLRKRALSGEDFAELAKENSEDGSAPRGGDLGYFKRGDMVGPFEDTAFSLKKEEISKVVETRFGYHLIKVLDKKAPHMLSYEEVENDIERFLLNRNKREKLDKVVGELRKNAKIEIY